MIEAVTVWQSPSGFGDTIGAHPDENEIERLRSVTVSGIRGPCPVLNEEKKKRRKEITMLMRFDPFRELDELTAQLRDGRRLRSMPLDAYRIGDLFHVDVDMPGVKPESIEVTVEKNVLTLKAERHWETEGVETVVCERPIGTFSRELFLGESLDAEKISASYENGVLRLSMPIAETAKVRHIEVKSSEKKEAIAASAA